MSKITVIGSFVMDAVAKMKRFPKVGETILGESIDFFPGGKGINQCVAVARLGGDVEMMGMVGKDFNGTVFRDIMNKENIKNDFVFTCERPTAVAQIQIDENGQNRICVIPSANFEFNESHLECVKESIKSTEFLVLQLEMRLDITKKIIEFAHSNNVPVLLNPAPAVVLDPVVLGMIDYLTPNETELEILTGVLVKTQKDIENAAKKLLQYGVKNVIVTLGDKGAFICNETASELVKGYAVSAVDTVAAGDSFNGALAVAIMEGKTLKEAVLFANAMGALTVQKQGAIPSLHTRSQVEEFIKRMA